MRYCVARGSGGTHLSGMEKVSEEHRAVRQAAAEFMIAREAAMRRTIAAQTRGMASVDPDDVFSTTLRRVDQAAANGSFQIRSDPESWGFVMGVARRAIERHRRRAARFSALLARLVRTEHPEDAPPETAERAELVLLVRQLAASRPQDAELVQLRLRGKRWREIAAQLGIGEEAARQRWSAMLARVRARIAP